MTTDPDSTKCPVCAEDFGDDPLICCTGCDTIHHRDCYEWNQTCGVYGCGGTLARPLRRGARDAASVEIGLIEVPGRAPTEAPEKPPWRATPGETTRRPRRRRFGQSVPLSFVAGMIFLGLIGSIGRKPREPRYSSGNSKMDQANHWRKQPWLVQVDGAHPRSLCGVYRNMFNHRSLKGWDPNSTARTYRAGCASSPMNCDKEACAEQKGVLGYVPGMEAAGRNYRTGTHWVRPSTRRSLYWFERAHLAGSDGVRDEVWEMASGPVLVEADPESYPVSTHVSQWPVEERRWHDQRALEEAAQGGDAWAAVCLGMRAEDKAAQEGALPDSLLPAARWHAMAVENGSVVGAARLHGIYLRGKKALSSHGDLREWAATMRGYKVARAAQDLRDS